MKDKVEYSLASADDQNDIIKLIKNCELPYEDLNDEKISSFITAKIDNTIIGCIGIEIFNSEGLLRSLAVDKEYSYKKIGSELYDKLISYSIETGVKTMHLLTTTAEDFFSRKGFIKTDRSNVPLVLKETVEFAALCPSNSTYMIYKKINTEI